MHYDVQNGLKALGMSGVASFGEIVADTADFTVMQSTGLTDRNGVEIYEGDVVLEPSSGNRYVVKWGALSDCCIHGVGFDNATEYHEVIGNIHQNPELLSA